MTCCTCGKSFYSPNKKAKYCGKICWRVAQSTPTEREAQGKRISAARSCRLFSNFKEKDGAV